MITRLTMSMSAMTVIGWTGIGLPLLPLQLPEPLPLFLQLLEMDRQQLPLLHLHPTAVLQLVITSTQRMELTTQRCRLLMLRAQLLFQA
jgi:hypothetical protein